MLIKNFSINGENNSCYKYLIDKPIPFKQNTKDLFSGNYFYGCFDETITQFENKINPILISIIKGEKPSHEEFIPNVILFCMLRTEAFRSYLIKIMKDFITQSLEKIKNIFSNTKIDLNNEETLTNFVIAKLQLTKDEIDNELKMLGYARSDRRGITNILEKTKKQYKKKLAIYTKNDKFFMGIHNILITKTMSALTTLNKMRYSVFDLNYNIPLGDTVCFFGIKNNDNKLSFISCEIISYFGTAKNDTPLIIFMPLSSTKILIVSDNPQETMESIDQKTLISAIVSTSYKSFIAKDDSFTSYSKLINQNSNQNNIEMEYILKGRFATKDPRENYLELIGYIDMLKELQKKIEQKSNYSSDNKELDNIDLVNDFLI
ncbi:hypothetical protein DM558_15440 [Entomomonas moraniae]|uniref:Uncharacterized protein n=1 Tax=Entomomonas moraniae TaxID=2213226 RepID=A0A451EQG3_9GAMM|nr:hypothetical protein [Entomomonas moraniae]AZS52080.1 hypothetical protein DM558_15440 [Entomomonas moraniae]